MDGPKTAERKVSARQGTSTQGNDEPKTPPNAPCLVRTANANANARAPPDHNVDNGDDDVGALFSKERPDESPTLKQNRRLVEATHTDLHYLDRPIARPMGPRPARSAHQRPKRHQHSEPVAGPLAGEKGSQVPEGRGPLVGPRPLLNFRVPTAINLTIR